MCRHVCDVRGFDLQGSVCDVDYAQEEVLIREASDNEDLFKGHLNTDLVLNCEAFGTV
jgi:hypothetical protein